MSTANDIGSDVKGKDAQITLEDTGLLSLAKMIFDAIVLALGATSEEEQRVAFEAVHRALVVFDDYLCERFSFSRKPRGKYIRHKEK